MLQGICISATYCRDLLWDNKVAAVFIIDLCCEMESCEIYSKNMFNYYEQHHSSSYPLKAMFVQEPPDDLRKSNFFKFIISFRGMNGEPVDIESARFISYINESHDMDVRNGIKYIVSFRYPNGIREHKSIYITLVDAATSEPIRYEGSDDSPKMRRVLLTHETICSRCSQQKSCGNKNEAPSDPLVVEKGSLKFFLKCNQNCLKGAGNPKDMRRFSMAMSFADITHDQSGIYALSKKIFVHNNSKHSRKRKKVSCFDPSQPSSTRVFELFPKVGRCGTLIAMFGDNFYPGMQVFMGTVPVMTEVVSEHLINARVPFLPVTSCPVMLRLGNQHINVGMFHYELPVHNPLSHVYPKVGIRGEEIIVFANHLPNSNVHITCNGLHLETKVLDSSGVITILPANSPLGMVELGLYWESQPIFWFSYLVQDRSQPGFSQTYGFLTLCLGGQLPSRVPSDGNYNEFRTASTPADSCYSSSPLSSSSNSSSSFLSSYCSMPFTEVCQEQSKEARNHLYEIQSLCQIDRGAVEEITTPSKQNRQMIKNTPSPVYFNSSSPDRIPIN